MCRDAGRKRLIVMQFVFIFGLIVFNGAGVYADFLDGLVGRWDFDDGTGKDLSGQGNDAVLGGLPR